MLTHYCVVYRIKALFYERGIFMNILLIGNGFDLAHGLPTRYSNFLDFIDVINKYKNYEGKFMDVDAWLNQAAKELNSEIVSILSNDFKNCNFVIVNNLYDRTKENIWIKYFEDNKNNIGKNWVDFESEISVIVKIIEESLTHNCFTGKIFMDAKRVKDFCKETKRDSINLLKLFKNIDEPDAEKTYSFIKKLNKDLDDLIIALQIYLYYFVNNIKNIDCKQFIESLDIDKVISFNYTDTYNRLYDKSGCAEYNYIHGKVHKDNYISKSDIVLGIEEYFDVEEQNKYLEFVSFKKYYQRIRKHTDSKYYDWITDIQKEQEEYYKKLSFKEKIKLCIWILKEKFRDIEHNLPLPQLNKEQHNLYIIGHSLDDNDKDILRELILNDNVTTTIYYYKKDYDKTICNLIKTIEMKEASLRTKGKNQTIFLVEQPEN